MSRKAFVAACAALLVFSIAGTAWAFSTEPERDGPGEFVVPSSAPAAGPDAPVVSGFASVSVPISVDVETHGICVGYGGAVRVLLNNSRSDRELRVVGERVVWLGGVVEKTVNVGVGARAVESLGLVWLPGPNFEGEQEYTVSLQILVWHSQAWARLGADGDTWTNFQAGALSVASASDGAEYSRRTNEYRYYDRTNALLIDGDDAAQALAEATAGLPGEGPTYERLCAVFDWASSEIAYVAEAEGEDLWQTPGETLSSRTGDCEDYALLIGDMVLAMGGTPRMYLIDEHAFAAVWVGADTSDAEGAVQRYYDANLKLAFIEDEGGWWIVVDPLGSMHLGGLAVGAEPVSSDGWDFVETTVLFGIDLTREPGEVRPWEDDRLWGMFQLACDVLLIAAVTLAFEGAPSCARCGRKFSGDIVECHACKAQQHPHCAGLGPCPRCGAPSQTPQLPPEQPPLRQT